MNQKQLSGTLLLAFVLVIALITITRFTNLKPHWGSLEMRSNATITVSGTAKKEQPNQIANFTAGVESIEETKEAALNKANEAMNELIIKVKEFGVKEEDIQTQNASVYQETEYVSTNDSVSSNLMYPQPDRGNAKKGDWRANNSITIKLREANQAEALLAILNASGANYVYGPDFSIDNTESTSDELLTEAVTNAREKAEKIAAANKQTVGKIISFTEGGVYPIYESYKSAIPMAGGSAVADASLEPGSSTTSKTVTVTFELN